MNTEKITEFLRTLAAEPVQRTPQCPDDHDVAAFVTGRLSPEHRERLQGHMADCNFCIRQAGLLSRLAETEPSAGISEFTLARAQRLCQPVRRIQPRYAVRWAAAAAAALAISLTVGWHSTRSPGPKPNSSPVGTAWQEPGLHQVRKSEAVLSAPRVLAPANGATVDPGELVVRWTGVPGSLYYDVRIVSDAGNLIWQQRADATQLPVPGKLGLEPGVEYFVRVDAYLADARSISSHHVPFTVRKRN